MLEAARLCPVCATFEAKIQYDSSTIRFECGSIFEPNGAAKNLTAKCKSDGAMRFRSLVFEASAIMVAMLKSDGAAPPSTIICPACTGTGSISLPSTEPAPPAEEAGP